MPEREVVVVVFFSKSGVKVSEHFQEHKRKKIVFTLQTKQQSISVDKWKEMSFS